MKYCKTGKYANSRKFFLSKEELQRRIESGMARDQIAQELKISPTLVSNYKTRYKIETPYIKSKICISKEQIESFIQQGASRADCARALKCNISTVQKFCEEYQTFFPKVEKDLNPSMRRYVLRSYMIGAKHRNLEFLLSEDYFYQLIVQPCIYCGDKERSVKQQTSYTRTNKLPFRYTGIDRIDSLKGYTVDNCVSCCFICNRAKREMSVNDFKEWIERLVKCNKK